MSDKKQFYRGGPREWLDSRGKLHRKDGPSVEWPRGTKAWYEDGVIRRIETGSGSTTAGGLRVEGG